MLALQDGHTFADRVLIDAGWWQCPACRFRRHYDTKQGALKGASDHLREAHAVRLTLPRREA